MDGNEIWGEEEEGEGREKAKEPRGKRVSMDPLPPLPPASTSGLSGPGHNRTEKKKKNAGPFSPYPPQLPPPQAIGVSLLLVEPELEVF